METIDTRCSECVNAVCKNSRLLFGDVLPRWKIGVDALQHWTAADSVVSVCGAHVSK